MGESGDILIRPVILLVVHIGLRVRLQCTIYVRCCRQPLGQTLPNHLHLGYGMGNNHQTAPKGTRGPQ